MRILHVDLDSLRPDHLGCYGYHRNTSPVIDRLAAEGIRFTGVHASDVPCLPSRTALWSGRCGLHTGVVNHGGVAAEPFVEGPGRGFDSTLGRTSWMRLLRDAGMRTATVSSFGERHAAWHWYANFSDIVNPGGGGLEPAEAVTPHALDWLRRKGKDDGWYLHVNYWDPHTPYRSPATLGSLFTGDPLPAWYSEAVRRDHWDRPGPHSAREVMGFSDADWWKGKYPQMPLRIDSTDAARMLFDGYDRGVRHADTHIGMLLAELERQKILDDTLIMISADHGETLGELNTYADHQLADHATCRVPMILRGPGLGDANRGRVDDGLHYQFDIAATLVELAGGRVPGNWDGRAFTDDLRAGRIRGRDHLVLSQMAWSCQRSVREGSLLLIHSYHDGLHALPDDMLFDVIADPHEQRDLATTRPADVTRLTARLNAWRADMLRTATHPVDPLDTVLAEGGPFHTRGELPKYLNRLRETGRARWADALAAKHPTEAS